uniref:Saposin B-type domain-containing protein n=1 Tax=Trichobilharzia regenti TaxID=157069 RepID=A0AA85K4J3_TRIRE|nr:unnamed protein product [Trichobilharzia regenti]
MFTQHFISSILCLIVIHLCCFLKGYQSVNEEILEKERLGSLCSKCQTTVTNVLSKVLNLDNQLKWEKEFLNGCEYTGPFRDYCASFFSSTMFKFINKIVANIEPHSFCQRLFLC